MRLNCLADPDRGGLGQDRTASARLQEFLPIKIERECASLGLEIEPSIRQY